MEEFNLTDSEFRALREVIHGLTGIALADGKRQLVKARLQRRLRELRLSRFQEYVDLVAQQGENGAECGELINAITTNKTDFYREAHHFRFVEEHLVPEQRLLAPPGHLRRLRVWHAGCSTGEEPYTMAASLAAAIPPGESWDIRLLASDIDTRVLTHAEKGMYEAARVGPVPEAALRRCFLRGGGSSAGMYLVKDELKRWITWRQINLQAANWPIRPDVRFDAIFCRNVMIYFDKPTRRHLIARFAEWLRPGGYLFLGHSESLLGLSDRFATVGATSFKLLPVPEATR